MVTTMRRCLGRLIANSLDLDQAMTRGARVPADYPFEKINEIV
jgi:hypothetical protein